MGGGPSKEQVEYQKRQAQLNETEQDNAAEIESTQAIHCEEHSRLDQEKQEKQQRLDDLREKNEDSIRERQNKLFEAQNSYMNELEKINEKHEERRKELGNESAKEIRELEVAFEKEKKELEEKNKIEEENIKKEAAIQKKVFENKIEEIEKEKSRVKDKRVDELNKFEKKEAERLKNHEIKLREGSASLLKIQQEQLEKLRELQQLENEKKEQILQNAIETMVIYQENANNKRLANNFHRNVVAEIQNTNDILAKAAVYMDDLDDEESRDLLQETTKEWNMAVRVTNDCIRDVRSDLNSYSSANQNLRESINDMISTVEEEYRGVQQLSTKLTIAIKNNNIPQLENLKTNFKRHYEAINKHGKIMSSIICKPDETLKKLESAHADANNQPSIKKE
ncbi:unnamed protein product [Caenorhabditis angaria]|uniref:Uncharacterized protein n=1 Tax=Caenorhabditis angaria TaxID=860376 RepID=A0A9P1N749_9PELO|nr:unnamed protein product [Caenorhabditis angaria]